MKIYYIIIEESGQYSDYNKTNLFVSNTEKVAQIKFDELNGPNKIKKNANSKFRELTLKWEKEILLPKGHTTEDRDLLAARRLLHYKDLKVKLAKEFNITEFDVEQGCHNTYSIEKVSSLD